MCHKCMCDTYMCHICVTHICVTHICHTYMYSVTALPKCMYTHTVFVSDLPEERDIPS